MAGLYIRLPIYISSSTTTSFCSYFFAVIIALCSQYRCLVSLFHLPRTEGSSFCIFKFLLSASTVFFRVLNALSIIINTLLHPINTCKRNIELDECIFSTPNPLFMHTCRHCLDDKNSVTCQSIHAERARSRQMGVANRYKVCSDWSTVKKCRPTIQRFVVDKKCRRRFFVTATLYFVGKCEQAVKRLLRRRNMASWRRPQ